MTDYTKLVEALRCCIQNPHETCVGCTYNIGNNECNVKSMIGDAAAAIEALQKDLTTIQKCYEIADTTVDEVLKQLPKLGEWQKAKPKGVVTYSDGYAECSHCHETIWLGWGMNFCPHCGTQNKIIDPDDYDGAKMEVQDDD